MKAKIVFGVSPDIRKASLIEISASSQHQDFAAQFRDVALTRP
jgi:hypothetical protein